MKWRLDGWKKREGGSVTHRQEQISVDRIYAFIVVDTPEGEGAVDFLARQALEQTAAEDSDFGKVLRAARDSHAPLEFNGTVMHELPHDGIVVEMLSSWLHDHCGLPVDEIDRMVEPMVGGRTWTTHGVVRDKVDGSTFKWLAMVCHK